MPNISTIDHFSRVSIQANPVPGCQRSPGDPRVPTGPSPRNPR